MPAEENIEPNQSNEPLGTYANGKIIFFKSFDEQEEYERRKMASLSHDELIDKLENMRKFFFKKYLLPDGSWPPLERIITIQKPKIS
jgi:hypothetical protein